MCGTVVSETKKQNSVCEKTSFHDTEKNQNIYKKNQSLRLERKRWNNNLKQLLRTNSKWINLQFKGNI